MRMKYFRTAWLLPSIFLTKPAVEFDVLRLVATVCLGDLLPRIKACSELIDTFCRDKSAEELQDMANKVKPSVLKEQPAAGLVDLSCTCHSLSDSPSSTGFKSVSPVEFQAWRRPVSPVLRPRVFVENCVDAAARLY